MATSSFKYPIHRSKLYSLFIENKITLGLAAYVIISIIMDNFHL